MIKYLSKFLNK